MIKVNKVHYSYDSTKILNGLNLLESDPIILGLWGRKGTGKTTLMKLLAGHLKPDQGEITLFGFNARGTSIQCDLEGKRCVSIRYALVIITIQISI